MGKSAPPPPDYRGAAEETHAGNLEMLEMQTRANRPTQITPWGEVQWTEGPGGQWTQEVLLSPEQQAALDSQLGLQAQRSELAGGMMGRVEREFGDTMDWSQFQELAGPLDRGQKYYDEAGDALYSRATSRLDPQWEAKRESTASQLRNQGLRPGDEAYDRQMEFLSQQETDAYQQAQFGATIGAGQEASRMFGLDQQAANYQNTLRQQQIAEEMQRRGFSLNEINAILHGQQVGMPSQPGFNAAERISGADYTGAARDTYSAEMDAFNAQQAMTQSVLNAGASAMSFSDIRLKRNVVLAGTYNGNRYYEWTWVWGGKGFGVMAHEMPSEFVAVHPSGYLMVDYGRF
jgi:hypothetical protein